MGKENNRPEVIHGKADEGALTGRPFQKLQLETSDKTIKLKLQEAMDQSLIMTGKCKKKSKATENSKKQINQEPQLTQE